MNFETKLLSSDIAALLGSNNSTSAILNGTTIVDPAPTLSGLLGANSMAPIAGSDIRDWIKKSDRTIFNHILKNARDNAIPDDAVVRIITAGDCEYGVHMTVTPLRHIDIEAESGDIKLIISGAETRHESLHTPYSGNKKLGDRITLLNDLAMHTGQTNHGTDALVAIKIDDRQTIENNHGFSGPEIVMHRMGRKLFESLYDRDAIYRTDTDQLVVLAQRDSIEAVNKLSETIQGQLTDHYFDSDNDANGLITVSVCYIGMNEGTDSRRSHTGRLTSVIAGTESLSRLGGNNYGHYGVIADIEASEEQITNQHIKNQISEVPETESLTQEITPDTTTSHEEAVETRPKYEYTPWTDALNEALTQNGFDLAYQGVTDLIGSDKPYFDVLLRYINHMGNLVSAGKFIPDAEKSGLMPQIDRWVIQEALKVTKQQRETQNPIGLFVKLSPSILTESWDFMVWLIQTSDEHNADRGDIIFSFRESDIYDYGKPIESLILKLRHEGFKTALTHVKHAQETSDLMDRIPFNFVKLPASIAHSIVTQKDNKEFYNMIQEIRQHDVPMIADQVEDADAMARLWQAGINYVQGYFVQEPNTETFDG